MAEDLESLRDILTAAINSIIDVCKRREEDFPRLGQPARPTEFTPEGIRNDPTVTDAIRIGVAAASQLIATLQSPAVSVTCQGYQAMIPAGMNVAERLHVAEILRDSGEAGMHISDIVKHTGASADKLARIMRHLATHHIFTEVSPDVFANNMISSLLDTGKDIEVIKRDPDSKFMGTNGIAAWASFANDDGLKSMVYLKDVMVDTEYSHSQETNKTAWQKAFKTTDTFWETLDRPEHSFELRRFSTSMKGTSAMQPPSAILTLYDWESLPEGATLVDVGCGLGHVSLQICGIRPDLTFVLEDRPAVMTETQANWEKNVTDPNARIHFIGSDYLQPQPTLPSAPDVFLLRNIVHDLSDKYAVILLHNLRQAAQPSTKLLLVDFIIEYACPVPKETATQVPGYEPMTAPAPLLPNFGAAGAFPYDLDIAMLDLFNSKERTIKDWQDVLSASGWKLSAVKKNPSNWAWWPILIAEPVY